MCFRVQAATCWNICPRRTDGSSWLMRLTETYRSRIQQEALEPKSRCVKQARMVTGAIIIKHTLCSSDEGTIANIHEPPQYAVSHRYEVFPGAPIFSPKLFVALRKRIDEKFSVHPAL